MRHVFAFAGFAFTGLMLAGFVAAPANAQQPQSETKAQPAAPEWCGFVDKLGSRVRCGYSTVIECKDSLGDKAAICLPDPSFADNRPRVMPG